MLLKTAALVSGCFVSFSLSLSLSLSFFFSPSVSLCVSCVNGTLYSFFQILTTFCFPSSFLCHCRAAFEQRSPMDEKAWCTHMVCFQELCLWLTR